MAEKSRVREYVKSILIAVILAFFIRTFIVQAFQIPSGSMEPTLKIGDHVLVNKFLYGIRIPYTRIRFLQFEMPRRGDVIVFLYPVDPSKDFIKRVIGKPGEKVEIIENKIYINDKRIPDPWGHFMEISAPRWYLRKIENFGPVIVPENSFFVLGDNRDNSEDSRFWGFVPDGNLVGRAWIIYFSWNPHAKDFWDKVRWSRFGKWIGR